MKSKSRCYISMLVERRPARHKESFIDFQCQSQDSWNLDGKKIDQTETGKGKSWQIKKRCFSSLLACPTRRTESAMLLAKLSLSSKYRSMGNGCSQNNGVNFGSFSQLRFFQTLCLGGLCESSKDLNSSWISTEENGPHSTQLLKGWITCAEQLELSDRTRSSAFVVGFLHNPDRGPTFPQSRTRLSQSNSIFHEFLFIFDSAERTKKNLETKK